MIRNRATLPALALAVLLSGGMALAAPLQDAAPDAIPVPTVSPRRAAPPIKSSEPEPEVTAPEEDPPPPAPDETALARCEAALRALGAVFTRDAPVDGPGRCGLPASYSVSQIVAGVALSPATQMRCETALATARWMSGVVAPAARVFGDDVRVTGIRHASTYVCRPRNGQAGAKMSEHARGNAIDVRRFEFEGRAPLDVAPRERTGSREEAFQKAVRAGGCLHFTTVLGPGSDAFHDDHLHLDLAQRNRGYRLCQ